MRKPQTLALLIILPGLLTLPFALPAQEPPHGSEPSTEPATTLKVDVKLVNVFVTVTDARGSPVAGLKKENFSVQEDGHEQKIAIFDKESALPLSIALAVDTSLSTRRDLPLEPSSAKRFAHLIMRA